MTEEEPVQINSILLQGSMGTYLVLPFFTLQKHGDVSCASATLGNQYLEQQNKGKKERGGPVRHRLNMKNCDCLEGKERYESQWNVFTGKS